MSLPRDPAGATKLTASGKSNLKAVSLFFSSFFLTELFVLFLLAPRAHSHTSCLLLHRSPIQAALFHLYELGDYWRLSGNFRNIKKGPSVNECRFACRIAVAFQIIGIWSFFQGIFWRNSKWKLTLITPSFFLRNLSWWNEAAPVLSHRFSACVTRQINFSSSITPHWLRKQTRSMG